MLDGVACALVASSRSPPSELVDPPISKESSIKDIRERPLVAASQPLPVDSASPTAP